MKIAIVEDLTRDSDMITAHLNTYFFNNYVGESPRIYNFNSGEEFLLTFAKDSYDIIFIDYYLKSLSGMDTAYSIRKKDPLTVIVFATASRDYAVEGYKVQASGYLVKPISYEDIAEFMSAINLKKLKKRRFIEITSGYQTIKIPLRDIVYCDISGHYVQIHTNTFGMQRSRMSFSELNQMLAPYPEFLMCYRGCMINMNHVEHMSDLTFFMDCGERIPFRKKDHNEILKVYSEFLFHKVREAPVRKSR